MNEPVITVEGVSKAFPLKTKQISLRHEAKSTVKKFLNNSGREHIPEFYALKNVTFSIQQGECVAIVGRNGSGKSTLLRVMTRIMRPTRGRVEVNGKYTALIGLGAGFISTMTGRENVFLNAAMHGIRPHQIEDQLDQIIDFAEIGQFIDAPVKDYSSGMYARLGFSVAIHILSDMIFLDEILAVGDAAFRQKCMERIMQLKRDKKTIIFVSHSEGAVRGLCERALWLHEGELIEDGPVDEVLREYNGRFAVAVRKK